MVKCMIKDGRIVSVSYDYDTITRPKVKVTIDANFYATDKELSEFQDAYLGFLPVSLMVQKEKKPKFMKLLLSAGCKPSKPMKASDFNISCKPIKKKRNRNVKNNPTA